MYIVRLPTWNYLCFMIVNNTLILAMSEAEHSVTQLLTNGFFYPLCCNLVLFIDTYKFKLQLEVVSDL